MILMSGFHLGQPPFKLALIHGIVRDTKGRKFSKSLGNGIDPIEMIDKYGADALRMGLISGAVMGSDIKFDENRIKAYKLFANKLWNITRFVLENGTADANITNHTLTSADQALLGEFDALVRDTTSDLEEHRLHLAAEKLYHYVWDRFASQILEESKEIFKGTDETAKRSRQEMLMHLLANSLKLLHPFMPFVTEEIWSSLPGTKDFLMVAPWPVSK